jgi:hypothetical protein
MYVMARPEPNFKQYLAGLPDFLDTTYQKREKIYQNDQKIYQMAIK